MFLSVFKTINLSYISNLYNKDVPKINLFLLDIDNTLLEPQNIFIYYKNESVEKIYTPGEYAELDVTDDTKKYYDYKDFSDEKKIKESIETSIPLSNNLDIIDNIIKSDNYEVGILTARGKEDLISDIMPKWLRTHLKTDNLSIKREFIYAISDKGKQYDGCTDSERKLLVLKKLVETNKYNITFIDDNLHTMTLIHKYNKKLKKNQKINLISV